MELNEMKQQLAVVQQQLLLKSNIVDVCALVDLKANAVETDKAIEDMQEIVNAKYEDFMREQRFINENLCPLNCVGKWIWHGSFTDG